MRLRTFDTSRFYQTHINIVAKDYQDIQSFARAISQDSYDVLHAPHFIPPDFCLRVVLYMEYSQTFQYRQVSVRQQLLKSGITGENEISKNNIMIQTC